MAHRAGEAFRDASITVTRVLQKPVDARIVKHRGFELSPQYASNMRCGPSILAGESIGVFPSSSFAFLVDNGVSEHGFLWRPPLWRPPQMEEEVVDVEAIRVIQSLYSGANEDEITTSRTQMP